MHQNLLEQVSHRDLNGVTGTGDLTEWPTPGTVFGNEFQDMDRVPAPDLCVSVPLSPHTEEAAQAEASSVNNEESPLHTAAQLSP